jgi:Ser/Thr protein kinase RdoA (MazF antagonist)
VDDLARIDRLIIALHAAWTPAARLPRQLVHGDVRLGNLRLDPGGETVIHDFGFASIRPRVHDLAYSLAYMVSGLGGAGDPASFDWELARTLVEVYETSAGMPLSDHEIEALPAYIAAVPLYHAVTAGFVADPLPALRSALPFVAVSEWALAHPGAVQPR